MYDARGDAPLRCLCESLAEAEAAAAAGSDELAAQQAAGGMPATRHGHSVADVAALRTALGGVVWTKSMRRM